MRPLQTQMSTMKRGFILSSLTIAILLIFSSLDANSQVADIKDITVLDNLYLTECGKPDTLSISVRAVTGSIYSIKITDSLPIGFECVGILSHPNIISTDLSNTRKPFFTIDSIEFTKTDTFHFLVKSYCGVSSAQQAYYQHIILDHSTGSQVKDGNNIISSIKAPVLQLIELGSNDVSDGIVSNTYTRKWKIQNTGLHSYLDSFYFRDILQIGTSFEDLRINGSSVTPVLSGDTVLYKIAQVLHDVSKNPNDTVLIEIDFKINSCTNSSQFSTSSAYWGCNGSVYCGEAVEKPAAQVSNEIPNLVKTLYNKKYSCPGGFDTMQYRIINTGKGAAANIDFDIATSYSMRTTDYTNRSSYFDTGYLVYKIGKYGTPQAMVRNQIYQSSLNRPFWPESNPAYRMNLGFPILLPGDTIFFDILAFRPCKGTYACGNYFSNYINSEVNYYNQCLNSKYIVNRRNDHGEASRAASTLIGPSDINNGDTSEFEFAFGSNSSTSYRSDVNGMMMILIEYPAGFIWDKDTQGLILKSVAHSRTDEPDSIAYDESSGTLAVFYKYNQTGTWNTTNSRARGTINPKFYLDCSVPGAGSNETISATAYDLRRGDCPDCWDQFTCKTTFTSNIHCPSPCPRGGVSPIGSTITRTTLGLPDNNRDGLPDSSGSLDLEKIDIKKLVAADTFKHEYFFRITKGSESPASFTHGYGYSDFPSPVGRFMVPLYATLQITDSSTGNTFTITNIPSSYSNSGSSRMVTWDFSPSATGIVGYPSGYEFDAKDSMLFTAYYQFNENGTNFGGDFTGSVANDFYVSPYANPTIDTAKYRCDIYNAEFEAVSNYFTVSNPDIYNVSGCSGYTAVYRTYLSIGECCSNYHTSEHFPYEYRAFGITDSVNVKVPFGYTIDSANLLFYHGAQTGTSRSYRKYSITPFSASSAMYKYNIAQHYTIHGGDIPPSDGGFVTYLYVYYKPTCETPNNVADVRRSDNYMGNINTWKNRPDIQAGQSGWNYYLNYGSGTTTFRGPKVSMNNVGPTSKYADEKVVYWDVNVQEISNNSNAENVWVAGYSKTGQIVIDSIINLSTNTPLVKSNDIFRVGTLTKGGGNHDLRVYVSYTNCYLDTLDLYTGWNCDNYPTSLSASPCISDTVSTYLEARFPALQTSFIERPARNFNNSGAEVSLCDTFQYILNVSNRKEAKAYGLEFDLFTTLGIIPVLDSIFVTYPAGSNTVYNIPATLVGAETYRIYLSQHIPELRENGLSKFSEGTSTNRVNEYELRVKFTTSCGFTSGSTDQFIARYKTGCDSQIVNSAQFDPIYLKSLPNAKYQYSYVTLLGDTVRGCTETTVLTAYFKNYELDNTTNDDLFRIVLPVGVTYSPNSVNPVRNPLSPKEPFIDSVYLPTGEMQTQLSWYLDTLIPKLDSAVFEFEVLGVAGENSCGNKPFITYSNTRYTDTCVVDGNPCSVFVQNDSFHSFLYLERSDINIDSGSFVVIRDTTSGTTRADSTEITVYVKNHGNYKGEASIQYFQDNDLDGFYTNGDTIISQDHMGTFEPDSMKVITKTISSKWGTAACPIGATIISPCDCKGDTTYNNGIPCSFVRLPVEYIDFTAELVHQKIAQLKWQTATEINNDIFAIYRRHEMESDFSYIGYVKGAGFSNQILSYSYTDNLNEYQEGLVYYQLKQIDFNGAYSYSNIEYVEMQQNIASQITVYPNPVKETLSVELPDAQQGLSCTVMDPLGKVYMTFTGKSSNQIPVSSLPKGIYFLKLDGYQEVIKFTKY